MMLKLIASTKESIAPPELVEWIELPVYLESSPYPRT